MEPNKISIVQKVLMRAIQKITSIKFEPLSQKLWAVMGTYNLPTTHQIWSCHVTLTTNFESIYFFPNTILKDL